VKNWFLFAIILLKPNGTLYSVCFKVRKPKLSSRSANDEKTKFFSNYQSRETTKLKITKRAE